MPQTELFILMPCAKPWNIPRIAHGILQCESHAFAIRWCILQQGTDVDPKGLIKLNQALDWVPSTAWFWTPSDDCIHAPSLIRRVGEIAAEHPDCGCIIVSEDRGIKESHAILHAAPENMKRCHVDGSQCFWRRDFVGDYRYDFAGCGDQADGEFVEHFYALDPKRFVFADEILCRFNSLEM